MLTLKHFGCYYSCITVHFLISGVGLDIFFPNIKMDFNTFLFPLFLYHLLLHGAELHPDNQLCLRRHVLEDVSFQPSEHVGAQQVMKLLDLVLLGDVSKLLQEALQVTGQSTGCKRRNLTTAG